MMGLHRRRTGRASGSVLAAVGVAVTFVAAACTGGSESIGSPPVDTVVPGPDEQPPEPTAVMSSTTSTAGVSTTTPPTTVAVSRDEPLPAIPTYGLYVIDLGTGEVTQLIADGNPHSRLSPDSSRIALLRDDGLFLADSDGTGQVQLTGASVHHRIHWYPDGSSLIYTSEEGTFVVDAESHEQVRIVEPSDTGDLSDVAVLTASEATGIRYSTPQGLFAVDADGTNRRHLIDLTNAPSPYPYPNRWSGATHVALFREEGFAIADIDGANERLVYRWTEDPDEWTTFPVSAEWSPDGTRLAFYSDTGSYLVDLVGNDPVRLSLSPYYASFYRPDWSHDSGHVALGVSEGLVIARSDGGDRQLLTPYGVHGFPRWSPDGTRVSYAIATARADRSEQGTYVADLNSGDTVRISGSILDSPHWSPDGSRMAYGGQGGYFLADGDGRNPKRLSRSGALGAGWPQWSPDGRFVAFADEESFFVAEADGSNPRKFSDDPYAELAWSDDGSRLAHVTPETLVRVDVEGSDETESRWVPGGVFIADADGGNGQQIAETFQYDVGRITWLPDGEHFLYAIWEHIE